MIDRLLKAHLEPIARQEQRWLRWCGLARCWAAAAMAGVGLLLIYKLAGWWSSLVLPVFVAVTAVAALVLWRRYRWIDPDYREIARRIECEDPKLHALLLTAVEQQPDGPAGELNYLQRRVVREALEHYRKRPWGQNTAINLFFAQCRHWAALALFLGVLIAIRMIAPSLSLPGFTRADSISVVPGDADLERGSSLVVMARFDGTVPKEATLVIKPLNEMERRIPLTKNLDDPIFGGSVPEVTADLTYHLEYSDQQTRDFKVTVFEYPKLERADARITYPKYTDLPAKEIEDTRRVSAVEGSLLDYTFHLNKPVKSATLVAKDKSSVPLAADNTRSNVYHIHFDLAQSQRYDLLLVDDANRTNRIPPQFIIDVLKNRTPELKIAFPRGDQRVSPLEEIAFQAEATDDFGLPAFGFAYTPAGQDTKFIELGQNASAHVKRPFNYTLSLEELGAQPDQLITYFIWADDTGPDGQVRRTSSDMYFAEVRPFDEIFREGQAPEGGGGAESGGNRDAERLADLQKQIINATWKLQRRETGKTPSPPFQQDATVVRQAQEQALEQTRAARERVDDPRSKALVEMVEKEMEQAVNHLTEASEENSPGALPPALSAEQSAYQAALRLAAREYRVSRGQNQRGGGGGGRQQRQLDQLELKEAENRYETQRQASAPQNPEQREQLQILSRLKELAQRQHDLNERLKELQTALQEAKTEEEREEIRRRLKRLREEEQELLADVDELNQRMERPENQSRMAEARQQLEQVRSEVQNAAEAMEDGSVPNALASGTRAQRELQELRDDFRKKSSSQFADDMRQMREDARQLAQREEEIGRQLDTLTDANRKTLRDSAERQQLGEQLGQQQAGFTNVVGQMRRVSEQAEAAEPLLSKQLYDTLRQTSQDDVTNIKELKNELLQQGRLTRSVYDTLSDQNRTGDGQSLDAAKDLLEGGRLMEASLMEQKARQGIAELKQGVERAAESVLGDDIEALRLARRELDDLTQQLENEIARAERGAGEDSNPSQQPENQPGSRTNPANDNREETRQRDGQRNGQGQTGERASNQDSQSQPATASANADGQSAQPQQGQTSQQASADAQGSQNQSGSAQQQSAQNQQNGGRSASETASTPNAESQGRGGNQPNRGARQSLLDLANSGTGEGGGPHGPILGPDYMNWSDRLRDVEELLDLPELRVEVARIRDRARAVRAEFKRHSKEPQWSLVKAQIATPLVEVRNAVSEELARREKSDAIVPIDRDPVPNRYSELVRRYYEQLGKSE